MHLRPYASHMILQVCNLKASHGVYGHSILVVMPFNHVVGKLVVAITIVVFGGGYQ